jgi:two-component system sensor histidine kinase UhpB
MTLAARLIILVAGALLLSLLAGGALILVAASRWVQAEIDTTARVARELVDERLAEAAEEAESPERLTELLRSLETGYHVQAVYRSQAAAPAAAGTVTVSPLSRLLGVHRVVQEIPVVLEGSPAGSITLTLDPERDVAQVWRAFELGLAAIALFSTTTLILVALGLTRSLRPLGKLAQALSRVGTGDYSPRIEPGGPREIAFLGQRFNRMTGQLQQMQARTRALNAQILAVQERERRDIARDLHDDLGPCLLAASLDVSALIRLNRSDRRAAVEECAAGLAAVLGRMQDLVRHMIDRLHLDPAEEFDLAAALDKLVGFWRERCPDIMWQVALGEGWRSLPPAAAVTLLRVAQEALTNAIRHSGAGRVTLSGDADDGGGFVMEIADDGKGMADGTREGIGLPGMRDRVEAIGGIFAVGSAPGRGTTITVRLPGAEPAASAASAGRVTESA